MEAVPVTSIEEYSGTTHTEGALSVLTVETEAIYTTVGGFLVQNLFF